MKKYLPALGMWLLFEAVAIVLWLALDDFFYLLNFTYIGSAIAVGLALYAGKWKYARNAVQFAVGTYMLVYLGLICRENMQLEGLWYYLFLGVFEAAVIHYAVAKIFGPLVFGRGWCGYACWTAMVLDLLPYKRPELPRRSWGYVRYVVFAVSLAYVVMLFVLHVPELERIMWFSFIAGNLTYYAVGIVLAYICRDNRAFCKYICPVTVFLRPMSRFALFRVRLDAERCISCGKCERICPMSIPVSSAAITGESAVECILCLKCVEECPQGALKF